MNFILNFFVKKNIIQVFNILIKYIKQKKKKLKISCLILFYIFKFYLLKIKKYVKHEMFQDPIFLELKSFLISFFFAFLFYYLIVIELSTLIWGYSLLCYRFLFIFLFILTVFSWRLEVSYIKNELSLMKTSGYPPEYWSYYYENKTPFSFYDYLTNYYRKRVFYQVVISPNLEKISEGWDMNFLYYSVIIVFFIYSCLYWFDPRFVKFVAKYFQPNVYFKDSWSFPRTEDIFSTPIIIRNNIVNELEYYFEDNESVLNLLSKIPKASPKRETRASWVFFNKNTLRPTAKYSDLFFLREVFQHKPLRSLAFQNQVPMVLSTKFNLNWEVMFLRYINSEVNQDVKGYWMKHFENDPNFWSYITLLKKNLNKKINDNTLWNQENYFNEGFNKTTFYDLLFSTNYLNNEPFPNEKSHEFQGKNFDFFEPLVSKNSVEKRYDINDTFSIFTAPIKTWYDLKIKDLFKYEFSGKKMFGFYSSIKDKITAPFDNFFFLKKKKIPTSEDLTWFYSNFNDTPFSSYKGLMQLKNPKNLFDFDLVKVHKPELRKILKAYDSRLTFLEKAAGLTIMPFSQKDYKIISWRWFIYLLYVRVYRLEQTLKPGNVFKRFAVYIPSKIDYENYNDRTFKMSWNARWILRNQKLNMKKIYFRFITKNQILEFLNYENWIRKCERYIDMWTALVLDASNKNFKNSYFKNLFYNNYEYPWFMNSLKAFSLKDHWMVMPGFVWFYQPTPYPAVFSTIGNSWFTYQLYLLKVANYVIAETNSLSLSSNTTPLVLYTGVEAVMYVKPVLDFIDYLVSIFIKVTSYFIEFLTTASIFQISNFSGTLVLAIHLTWFIHYYIYIFIVFYVLFYAVKYYYYMMNSSWLYETMIETTIITQHNGYVYWHNMNQLWSNFKTPEQILTLKLHSLMLVNFTTQNHLNYYSVNHKSLEPLVNIFMSLVTYKTIFKNYQLFKSYAQKISSTEKKDLIFSTIKNFYYIYWHEYSVLFHLGGSDNNFDTLVWNYYNYLSQVSIFLSRSIWNNIYKVNEQTKLISLIKQFTVSLSSSALVENQMFMISPLVDNSINWKLLKNLIFQLSSQILLKKTFNEKNLSEIFNNKTLIDYLNLKSKLYELTTLTVTSSQEIYLILNSIPSFLSKLNVGSIWDSQIYWILAFLRSFRFVSKSKYPFINFSPFHEHSRNILRKSAYLNSWVAHSMHSWPFFSLTQHIWWSSCLSSRPKSLTDTFYNVDSLGLNNIDQVRNFQEKWYSRNFYEKIETVFGFVRSLSFPKYQTTKHYGTLNNYQSNFDITFDEENLATYETSRGYNKVNPPLNCAELGITPSFLISLFKNLPKHKLTFIFSFIEQLNIINDNAPSYKKNNSFELYEFDDVFHDLYDYVDPELLSQHDFYTKRYKYLLKENSWFFLKNWIFSFDTSYFLSLFSTWDYFTRELNSLRPNKLNFKENFFLIENLVNVFSVEDMWSSLTTAGHFLKKPVGSVDKFELFIMKKYNFIKSIDYLSITRKRESPFMNLDRDFLVGKIGLATWPNKDFWTVGDSYDERFGGLWEKWVPFNIPANRSLVKPIILGWVGELYNNTKTITSFFFSLAYWTRYLNPENHAIAATLVSYEKDDTYLKKDFQSYFGPDYHHIYLGSKSFSWVNFVLSPANNRYFFGLKPGARADYWSWKCGYHLDYQNGFFTCRPYLGMWFFLGARLNSGDSVFGFYRAYRQIDDDVSEIDPSTDALRVLLEGTEDPIFNNDPIDPETFDVNDPINRSVWNILELTYREIFFCFQHPFFLGYFMFWYLVHMAKDYYLGVTNYSAKWSFFWRLIKKSSLGYNWNLIFKNKWRTNNENTLWKSMSWFRIYWINPITLTNSFSFGFENWKKDQLPDSEKFYNIFLHFTVLYNFFKSGLYLNNFEVINFLNLWKTELNLLKINWLSLDNPFTLNPYIVEPYQEFKTIFKNSSSSFFNLSHLKFSHYDSLWENINFNILCDWSSGSYLDTLNLTSYYSSFWSLSMLPSHFLDNPDYVAATSLLDAHDNSFDFALSEKSKSLFMVDDILIGESLMMHNLSILHFLTSTLTYSARASLNFFEFTYTKSLLDFYIKESFDSDFNSFVLSGEYVFDVPFSATMTKTKSKLKHIYFSWNLGYLNQLDLINVWLETGLHFWSKKALNLFLNSFKFKIYYKINATKFFYKKIGYFIKSNFFR